MKKKHRNITVDGDDSWAWAAKSDFSHDTTVLKIWKHKKVVYERKFHMYAMLSEAPIKRYSFTPGLISRFIKIYLRDEY